MSSTELEKIKNGNTFVKRNGEELTKNGKRGYNLVRGFQDLTVPMFGTPLGMSIFSLATGQLSLAIIAGMGALTSCIIINTMPLSYRKDALLIVAKTFQPKTALKHLESTPWAGQEINGKKLKTNRHYLEYKNEDEHGIIEIIVHRKKFRDMIISMTKYATGANSNPLLENLGSWDEALKLAK